MSWAVGSLWVGLFWCPFAHLCWFIRVGNGNMIWPMLGENRLWFHRVTGEWSGCPQILKRAHLICVWGMLQHTPWPFWPSVLVTVLCSSFSLLKSICCVPSEAFCLPPSQGGWGLSSCHQLQVAQRPHGCRAEGERWPVKMCRSRLGALVSG